MESFARHDNVVENGDQRPQIYCFSFFFKYGVKIQFCVSVIGPILDWGRRLRLSHNRYGRDDNGYSKANG